MTSFRAEAAGAHKMIIYCNMKSELFLCDNQVLINNLESDIPMNLLATEWELVEPTKKALLLSETSIRHIKVHQDDDEEQELSDEAKINIHAILLESTALSHIKPPHTTHQGFRSLLLIDDVPFTTRYAKIIRLASNTNITTA